MSPARTSTFGAAHRDDARGTAAGGDGRGRAAGSVRAVLRRPVWLCDLDGTLVDSAPVHAEAFRAAIAEVAPDLLDGFRYDAYAGASTRAVVARIGASGEVARRLVLRKQRLYREYVDAGRVEVYPGAYRLLDRLLARGSAVYLVTGGSRGSVERVLAACSLAHRFRGVLTSDDVAASKPDPEVYRQACRRWHVDPADAVVVEDSPQGVASAVGAGLATLQVHAHRPAEGALAPGTLDAIVALLDGGDHEWRYGSGSAR